MNKVSQTLDFRQSQNLVMTPQLQQAIKLLQLNNMELAEFIEDELAQNPLLEKDSGERETGDQGGSEGDASDDSAPDDMEQNFEDNWDEGPDPSDSGSAGSEEFDPTSKADIGAGGNSSFENLDQRFENALSRPETLRDHMEEQVHIAFSDARDRLIAEQMIDMLDESGYLRESPEELAERLGCKPDRIERLLDDMRQFDPTGIFAHDLADCLGLQLAEKDLLDERYQALLDNLDVLAAHDHKKLAGLCGVDADEMKEMIATIRSLNPKPASEFDHLIVQTVVPDVLMKKQPTHLGGGWRVELNQETLPKLLVNREYYTTVASRANRKEDKAYLNEQLQSANWIVNAMDQRAKTIVKVAAELIEQQNGFFLYGIEFLKPLTLKDIAEEVDMHESTISRVTTNKYIGTPRGIFELKFFFSASVGSGDNIHSAESIKARIKTMIEGETADTVLSDDEIAARLKGDGVDVARRTVAKYREAMRIASSVQRRREKKAAG